MKKKYSRRWKGFSEKEVHERMSMIAAKRWPDKKGIAQKKHSEMMHRAKKLKHKV